MKKFKQVLFGLVASVMMVSTTTVYAQASETLVVQDGSLVIICRESVICPMLDHSIHMRSH